jgi:putative SOS response-associated peptidase YedK
VGTVELDPITVHRKVVGGVSGGTWTAIRFVRRRAPTRLAGMWDRCTTSDAGEVNSFTLTTGPSAGPLGDYHDRAPVVLDPADWGVWLDPAQDATAVMAAVRPERFVVGAG